MPEIDTQVQAAAESTQVDIFSMFATDEAAEADGVYTQLEGCGDTEFRVARWGNKKFFKQINRLNEKNKVALKAKGEKSEKLATEILIDTMADTILLGWKGTVKMKKESLAYSRENAKRLLEITGFRRVVIEAAEDTNKFLVEQEKEEEGN